MSTKPNRKPARPEPVTFTVDPEAYAAMKELAKAQGKSLRQWIKDEVKKFLSE